MKTTSPSRRRFSARMKTDELLADLFDRFQDSFDKQQWPWEIQRWHELVYCLLSVVEGRFGSETSSASAMRVLRDLNLLDPSVLANGEETTRLHLTVVFERLGFSKEQTGQLVRALHDLAKCLLETYQGKVQLLLRTFGMELVESVLQVLPLENSLGRQSATLIVTHWLQNVLDLPVLVSSPGLEALLAETGAQTEEVLAAADEVDINVALLDEILNRWVDAHPLVPEEVSSR